MEIALTKTNLKEPTVIYTTATNNSRKRETETEKIITTKENKTNTHLTIIGVCTTICPENSGM